MLLALRAEMCLLTVDSQIAAEVLTSRIGSNLLVIPKGDLSKFLELPAGKVGDIIKFGECTTAFTIVASILGRSRIPGTYSIYILDANFEACRQAIFKSNLGDCDAILLGFLFVFFNLTGDERSQRGASQSP